MQEYVNRNMQTYANTCNHIQIYAQNMENMSKYVKICTKYAQNMSKSAKMCIKYANIYKYMQGSLCY